MTLTKTQRRRLVALSSIVGIMIGIGITVAAGGTLFYTFQSQTDPFTTSSSIEVRNLNAVLKADTLSVTATVKNSGQTSITNVFVNEITVSDITFKQDATDGGGTLSGTGKNTTVVWTQAQLEIAGMEGAGLDSTIEGGRSTALVLKITSSGGTNIPDIGDDVNISDKLNLVLRFTSGQDELLTDVFTTRVKPG